MLIETMSSRHHFCSLKELFVIDPSGCIFWCVFWKSGASPLRRSQQHSICQWISRFDGHNLRRWKTSVVISFDSMMVIIQTPDYLHVIGAAENRIDVAIWMTEIVPSWRIRNQLWSRSYHALSWWSNHRNDSSSENCCEQKSLFSLSQTYKLEWDHSETIRCQTWVKMGCPFSMLRNRETMIEMWMTLWVVHEGSATFSLDLEPWKHHYLSISIEG
jgi:hypothetical protein